jgi:hypothetical protein
MKTVTIWGLKNKRDSFRFIHKGFYENFMKLGYETKWVDDSVGNQNIHSDLFFVCGVASKHIKFNKYSNYVLHNVDLNSADAENIQKNNINYLNLQVFTNDAKGEILENGNIMYNHDLNTLFQPWGTPLSPSEWQDYVPKSNSKKEFWVGAIWNNQQNQGNKVTMEIYRKLLRRYDISLIKRGGSRIKLNGLSDYANSQLVRKSRFGATIVGDWQRNAAYIPCRLYKNISFGIAPISNMKPPIFIKDKSGFIENLEELIDFGIAENEKNRKLRFESAKNDLKAFSYEENIKRIIKLIGSR